MKVPIKERFPLMPNVLSFAQLSDYCISPLPEPSDTLKYLLCFDEPLSHSLTVPFSALTRSQLQSLVLPADELA